MMLVAIFAASIAASGAPKKSAQDVFNSATAAIRNAKGVQATFSLSGGASGKGEFKASGNKFMLSTGLGTTWYDGKTMWVYNPGSNETSVFIPSAAEIAECNPLSYVSTHASQFKATYAEKQLSGTYNLVLTPTSKSNSVQRAVLTIDAKTLAPKKLVVRVGKQSITVNIHSFNKNVAIAAGAFTYPQSKYPKTKLIDLR